MFNKKKKDQQKLMLEFVKTLADNQEATTKQLETLNKLLENGSLGKLSYDPNGLSITSKLDNIQVQLNNCVTPITVEEYVQKEFSYNKDYDKRHEKNKDLMEFIETYCKFEDKYEALNLFDMIDSKYDIKKKK